MESPPASCLAFIFSLIPSAFPITSMPILYMAKSIILPSRTAAPLPRDAASLYASIIFAGRARGIFRELRIKIAEINSRFAETIGGIRVVQLFRQEVNNYRLFKQLNHENYLAGMKQIHVLAVFMPLIEILGVVAVALVIWYGGGRVLTGTLSLG